MEVAEVSSLEDAHDTAKMWHETPTAYPRLLLKSAQRSKFDDVYRSTLRRDQEAFDRFVRITDDTEKQAAADSIEDRIRMVVRSDALRDVLSASDPFWSLVLPSVATAALTPLDIMGNFGFATLVSMVAAILITLIVDFIILFPLPTLLTLLTGRTDIGDALAPLLGVTATVGVLWAVLVARPFGYEAISGGRLGSMVLMTLIFLLWILIPGTTVLVLRRLKIARDPEGEIIETLLAILHRLAIDESVTPSTGLRSAAEDLQYVALILDTNWRTLVPECTSGVVGLRWRHTTARVAAGLRDLASRAAFPGPDFSGTLAESLSVELTAFVTRNYGDLIVAEFDGDDSIKPRLLTIWRRTGPAVASVAPLALLLVVPRLFDVELGRGLFGTLLTISLAWLILYIVNWLDPRSSTRTGGISGFVDSLGKGSGA